MPRNKANKPKTIKVNNRREILVQFITSDDLTVADIRQHINLSKTTLTKVLGYLLDSKLIVETGKNASTDEGGRKAITYAFNSTYKYCMAFHIFPDEVYGVLTDLKCNILHRFSTPITKDITFPDLMKKILRGLRELLDMQSITYTDLIGLSVGSHGLTDYFTGNSYYSPHFQNWPSDISIMDALKKLFPYIPYIFVDNQIRFQALAEHKLGTGHLRKNLIVIEAGVGLVAGIIMNNQLKRGTHSFAGEIGHMPLDPYSDCQCSCGGKGCFEAMVSEERLVAMALSLKDEYANSPLYKLEIITLSDILHHAKNGDPLCHRIVKDACVWWAIGITNTVLMYDPDLIVLQGVYTEGGHYFLNLVKKEMYKRSPLLNKIQVDLRLSTFGKDRGTLGGAYYIVEQFIRHVNLDD